MQTTAIQPSSAAVDGSGRQGFSELTGEDFFRLMVAQLMNQDPMEPTSNEELLNQMAAIRDIEMNTSLTGALKSLSEQQQFGSASAMIGQHVTGQPGADGQSLSGRVMAIRFAADGSIVLQLDSGAELNLADLATVTSPERAAQNLVGKFVTGVDRRDPLNPETTEGVVTGVRSEQGEVILELDTGKQVRFVDVTSVETMGPDRELGLTDLITEPLKTIGEVLTWV
jgi:hypothetical protein